MKRNRLVSLVAGMLLALGVCYAAPENYEMTPAAKAAAEKVIASYKADAMQGMNDWMSFLEDKTLKKERKSKYALTIWGNMFLENKLYENANEMGRLAYETDGEYLPAVMLYAESFNGMKKYGDAAAFFEQAIQLAPDEKTPYLKTAEVYKYINPEHALEILNNYKQKFPNDPDVNKSIAAIYYYQNNIEEAIKAYDVYFKEAKDNATIDALEEYAVLLFLKKDYQGSLDQVNKVLPKDPKAISLNRMKFYDNMELMQINAAKEAADKFFSMYTDSLYNASDYKYRGQLADMMMDTMTMLKSYEKAAKLDPEKPEIQKGLSEAYERIGEPDKAVEAYKKYIDATNPGALTGTLKEGKIYYAAAAAIEDSTKFDLKKKYVEQGEEYFKKVDEKAPESYFGPFWRARIRVVLDPNTPKEDIMNLYQEAYKRMEGKDESYNTERVECLFYAAFYYFQMDDHANSLIYCDKVLAIKPDHKVALRIKEIIGK